MSILSSWKVERFEKQKESGYCFAIMNLHKERLTIEILENNLLLSEKSCSYDHFDMGIQEALDDYKKLVNKLSTFKN